MLILFTQFLELEQFHSISIFGLDSFLFSTCLVEKEGEFLLYTQYIKGRGKVKEAIEKEEEGGGGKKKENK